MWKFAGLVFTDPQLTQLFNYLRPERAGMTNSPSTVYQAVIGFAFKKNLNLIPIDVIKPNGRRVTRYLLCIYSKPASWKEMLAVFEKWEEGEKVVKIRKWLTDHGVAEPLPFDTFVV